MAETLFVPETSIKSEKYEALLPQIAAIVEGETDLIANLANVVAVLKTGFDFFWVGFYLVKENQLVLGPFQGPIACTRIRFDKGVCGACYTQAQTIVVEDVELFPGHIACSSLSRSEIVVPGFKVGKVFLVLDIDSTELADFNETDKIYLEKMMRNLEKTF